MFGRRAPLGPIILISLVIALSGLGAQVTVSQETSSAWSAPLRINTNEKAWDPDLTADASGRVHAVWVGASDPAPGATGDTIYYSCWDGSQWSAPVDVLVLPGVEASDRPALAADRDRLYVVWPGSTGDVYFSSAPASCASSAWAWSRPRPVFSGAATFSFVDLKVDPAGELNLVWAEQGDDRVRVVYSKSDDGGWNWHEPLHLGRGVSATVEHDPRLAIANNGDLHVTWSITQFPDGRPLLGVFYTRSEDGGTSWLSPVQVADNYGYGRATVGIGETDDIVHLIWSGTIGYNGRYHRWSADGGNTWTDVTKLPGLEDSFGNSFTEMVNGPSGTLHIVAGVEHQRYSKWQDGVWSPAETIADVISDSARGVEGGMPQLVMARGNELVMVFHDGWNIFFATKIINAPRQEVVPLEEPNLVPITPALTIEHDELNALDVVTALTPSTLGGQLPESRTSRSFPVLLSVVPTLIVLFLAALRRTHRS